MPDLNVTSITINPGETRGEDILRVYVNESNNISAVVFNNGSANAGAFDVCFDADGVKIGCVAVAGLAAGDKTTLSIHWTPSCADYQVMPGFPAHSLPLTINVTADCNCADCPICPADGSNGQIAESDETNNLLAKVIPAIQIYSTYDVIGGVVNNGYKSKNFDCNTMEEPLTLFEHDEAIYGGVVYNVSGTKISSFNPGDTSTRTHHIDIPAGATVKKARLYVYWYDKWGNYKTYPTGCLADLSVTFDGTEFMPDVKYNDQKGFGYYHSPKGTYAYDVTSKVTGSGDYTAIVENIDPANATTLLGEMLLVGYEDASGTEIQLWIMEGNDYLMAADGTHGDYNYCVSLEEATATVTFPGTVVRSKVISSAELITVVAQGMAPGSNMLFNDNVIKTDAWDAPTEAYPNSKINVEVVDVTDNMAASDNTLGFQDTGTGGMQASNAFLVVEYEKEVPCPAEYAVYQAKVSDPEGRLNKLRALRDEKLDDGYVTSYYDNSQALTLVLSKADPDLVKDGAQLLSKYSIPVGLHVQGMDVDKRITRQDVEEVLSFTERLKIEVMKNSDAIGADRTEATIVFIDEFEGQVKASEGKTFSEALKSSIYYEGGQLRANPATVKE